jgi:hypothetical protein
MPTHLLWELFGLAHREFLINLKGLFMHSEWQLFSPTLLVDVESTLFIRWVALYAFASVCRRGERGKHTHALTRLIGRGEVMGAGARRTCE